MPTYEYACRDCEEHLEVVQSFHDDALTECPACAGELRKVFSAAGIIFKGSGWHIKDYASSRSGSAPSSSDTASGADGSTGSKGESKGDSKGDSTPGTKDTATSSSDGSSSSNGSSGSSSSASSEKAAPAKRSA